MFYLILFSLIMLVLSITINVKQPLHMTRNKQPFFWGVLLGIEVIFLFTKTWVASMVELSYIAVKDYFPGSTKASDLLRHEQTWTVDYFPFFVLKLVLGLMAAALIVLFAIALLSQLKVSNTAVKENKNETEETEPYIKRQDKVKWLHLPWYIVRGYEEALLFTGQSIPRKGRHARDVYWYNPCSWLGGIHFKWPFLQSVVKAFQTVFSFKELQTEMQFTAGTEEASRKEFDLGMAESKRVGPQAFFRLFMRMIIANSVKWWRLGEETIYGMGEITDHPVKADTAGVKRTVTNLQIYVKGLIESTTQRIMESMFISDLKHLSGYLLLVLKTSRLKAERKTAEEDVECMLQERRRTHIKVTNAKRYVDRVTIQLSNLTDDINSFWRAVNHHRVWSMSWWNLVLPALPALLEQNLRHSKLIRELQNAETALQRAKSQKKLFTEAYNKLCTILDDVKKADDKKAREYARKKAGKTGPTTSADDDIQREDVDPLLRSEYADRYWRWYEQYGQPTRLIPHVRHYYIKHELRWPANLPLILAWLLNPIKWILQALQVKWFRIDFTECYPFGRHEILSMPCRWEKDNVWLKQLSNNWRYTHVRHVADVQFNNRQHQRILDRYYADLDLQQPHSLQMRLWREGLLVSELGIIDVQPEPGLAEAYRKLGEAQVDRATAQVKLRSRLDEQQMVLELRIVSADSDVAKARTWLIKTGVISYPSGCDTDEERNQFIRGGALPKDQQDRILNLMMFHDLEDTLKKMSAEMGKGGNLLLGLTDIFKAAGIKMPTYAS